MLFWVVVTDCKRVPKSAFSNFGSFSTSTKVGGAHLCVNTWDAQKEEKNCLKLGLLMVKQ